MDVAERFLKPLETSISSLLQLARHFSVTFGELALASTEQFLPTPVTKLPSGQEHGQFLALDVGGTNLRVAILELLQSKYAQQETSVNIPTAPSLTPDPICRRRFEKSWPIGDHLKWGNGPDLFEWIGSCMAEVVSEYAQATIEDIGADFPAQELPVGITFSFPMEQHLISEATLMPMGKGFTLASDKRELSALLLSGYGRHVAEISATTGRILPKLRIAAIVNDTVATLASLAYTVNAKPRSHVVMGLIVATGTNAAVSMKTTQIGPAKRLPSKENHPENVVVNTEWSIRGTAAPLKHLGFWTKWDDVLDRACEAPGFQPFETMTAGRYLGELVRIILVDFLQTELQLSGDSIPGGLKQRNSVETSFIGKLTLKSGRDEEVLVEVQKRLPPPPGSHWRWTAEYIQILLQVIELVQTRSAGMVAAAIVGLLVCTEELHLEAGPASEKEQQSQPLYATNGTVDQMTPEELVVACTGGMVTHYPDYLTTCQSYVDQLLDTVQYQSTQKRVVLQEVLNAGLIGAAALAATFESTP